LWSQPGADGGRQELARALSQWDNADMRLACTRTVIACVVLAAASLILCGGCGRDSDQVDTRQQLHEGLCPYKLILEPVTREPNKAVVDLTVENASERAVGWDSEFSAGIQINVWIVPSELLDSDERDLQKPSARRRPYTTGLVPDADRFDRSRFVKLGPGRSL